MEAVRRDQTWSVVLAANSEGSFYAIQSNRKTSKTVLSSTDFDFEQKLISGFAVQQ